MPYANSYRRPAHRSRRAPQSDALTSALTAQVLVCVLLLLAAVVARQADPAAYETVKHQYDDMVTEPADGQSAFAGLSDLGGGLQDAFARIEQWISALVGSFGDSPPQPDSAADAPTEQGAQPAWQFDYDYLGQNGIARIGAGMGGQYPVPNDRAADTPPPDATYAAVEIAGRVRPPLAGPVTSPFAYREHPLSGADDFHTGIDIAAAEGRAVLAALPGEVAEVGESEIYGLYVILRHAPNFETFYAHCSEIIAAEGMQVRQGERIAKVGRTGVATGPHLHFSVLVDGLYTDPFWALRDHIRLVED